jgi:hypothetical protein
LYLAEIKEANTNRLVRNPKVRCFSLNVKEIAYGQAGKLRAFPN